MPLSPASIERLRAKWTQECEREWKCRTCPSLIYASHRHGPRHPSRQLLPYRTRRRRQREAKRQIRTAERHRRALQRAEQTAALRLNRCSSADEHVNVAITIGSEQQRPVSPVQLAAEASVRAALDADAEENARWLAGSPLTPKRLRTKAAKFLADRAPKQPEPTASSPEAVAPTLTPSAIARLERAARRLDFGEDAQPTPAPESPVPSGTPSVREMRAQADALLRRLDDMMRRH